MIIPSNHETFIERCFELARNGQGNVAPNPLVGSVIVCNNRIIGEGYHHKFGDIHAEVDAINSVKEKELLQQATLYVNLEPCSHYGKTPPCSDLIIRNKIPKVVISNVDPHEQVKGKGIEKLRKAGIEVITDVLHDKGEELNRRFFTYHRKLRPYIILKWAQTADGYIDVKRNPLVPEKPNWITNEQARMLVHKWRTEEQAIMIGTSTAFIDNPKLNVRNWYGKDPLRVIIDRSLRLPANLNVFDGSAATLVFTENLGHALNIHNVEYIPVDFNESLITRILDELYKRNVISVIIEGGAKLLNTFIASGLWDEARIFTGNIRFSDGIEAPKFENKPIITENWKEFKLYIYRN